MHFFSPTRLIPAMFFLLTSAARPDALPPPKIPDAVGVNIHFTGAPAADLDKIQAGGFGWIRMDFLWASIEKTKGGYDYAAYDELLDGLTKRGVKPVFILDYGNELYGKGSPRTTEARAAFAKWAADAAARYAGKPIVWELWNEPNIGFWTPKPNADEYARLAVETAQAIKKADPKATIITGGTSGFPLDFIETYLKAGLLKWTNAVAVHPYRQTAPETAAADYRALRQLIEKYAPGKNVPIVSSEWGYSTVGVSEDTQAQYLTRQWLLNLSQNVNLSIWYDWKEDGDDPKENEHHFGTVKPDLTNKYAFRCAQNLTTILRGYRFVKRIPLASDDDWLLLFTRGPGDVKLTAWTVGKDHAITLPIAGTPALRHMDGSVEVQEKSATPGRMKLTLTQSPQYLAPSAAGNETLAAAAQWTATPQNEFYSAKDAVKLALTYANTDKAAHKVEYLVSLTPPGETEGQQMQTGTTTATAGHSLRQTLTAAALSRVPVRARVALILDGVRQPYPQDILFMPTDPLTLTIAPAGAGGFRARVENPSGAAFVGILDRTAAGQTIHLPIRLAAGQKLLDTAVLGDPARATAFALRDAKQDVVARLPARRFVPYPLAAAALRVTLDGDPKVVSTITPTPSPTDPSVLKVAYQFGTGWTFWRVSEASPAPISGNPQAFGLWVYGDGSGSRVRMRFQDATGQTFQPDGGRMDWTGWQFVVFPLTQSKLADAGHWGGANDGVIHAPLHLDSLFLLDPAGGAKKSKGTLSLGRPSVIYATEQ